VNAARSNVPLLLTLTVHVTEARRLKQLEDENRRLKHLVADLTLDNQALKVIVGKKY